MKKYKTDNIIIHIETETKFGTKYITVDCSERGCYGNALRFAIPEEVSKKTISDVGLAKHILNYFIKD